MTSREIIRQCIRFQSPPRVGLYFAKFDADDTVDVFDFFQKDEDGVDPWGTRWVVHPDIPSIGMPKEHPVKTPADAALLAAPDPQAFADKVADNLQKLTPEHRDKYRFIATSSGIWERIQYWRGMDRVFEDLALEPELVHRMVGLCTEFWVSFLEALAPQADDLDAIYMFDDWGTQDDIMISQPMWREFFAEPYRRITAAAHANDMDFWLHSCGRVTNLIADFIDVGMDLVNPYQSGTCGYAHVAEHFAGKIAFLTTVDTQITLPHGTLEQVRAECPLVEKWGTDEGGLIVAGYGYDIPDEKEQIVFNYFNGRSPQA
jgi:uroporphyrinogen-III decarboxylase